MRAHVVVIGGGVMGTAIALELARRLDPIEQPVLLLERRELAAGSSGRSGAILRQHYAQREVASMARDSLRVWAGFEAATGYSIGFLRTGVVTLAGPERPDECERVVRNVEMLRSIGVDTRLVDGDELRRLVPGIAFAPGTLAAYEPDGGCVDPRRAVEAFAALARFRGATVRTGVEVVDFVLEAGRLRAVETSEGRVECELAVVAAGPWTRRLMARAGLDLPLTAVRPEQHFLAMLAASPASSAPRELSSTTLHWPGESPEASSKSPRPAAAHPVLLDVAHGYYARCEPESGRTRIGGMDYAECDVLEDPDDLSEEVGREFQRWARGALSRRIPAYAAQPDAGSLAGWYTLSPDSQALLGPLASLPGVFLAAGFSGHGFKLAPSIGEGLARAVLGQPPGTYDPEFFAPDRFARGAVRAGSGAFGM
jgi:sarcosine oxidase subunit beta